MGDWKIGRDDGVGSTKNGAPTAYYHMTTTKKGRRTKETTIKNSRSEERYAPTGVGPTSFLLGLCHEYAMRGDYKPRSQ